MKHVIMVMGHGNERILQKTIDLLDDEDIDFVIHWDKKFKMPSLESKKSKIIFLNNRIKVTWGTDSQIIAEKRLFQYVLDAGKYDYVHLISSNDIPLMTLDYFKEYFKKGSYFLGFVDYLADESFNHINEYYPIRNINLKKIYSLSFIIHVINRLLKVNRVSRNMVEKGCNWFSMDIVYLKKVVEFKNFKMFKHTFTGDEFYVQTILKELKPPKLENKYDYFSDSYRMTKSSEMASRYIDWYRGRPYTFTESDVSELVDVVNTKYAFSRKVIDSGIVESIFNELGD